jgi:hypothetical protein
MLAAGFVPASNAWAVHGTAFTVRASLTVDGLQTQLRPVALAQGEGPPAYDRTQRRASTNDHLFFVAAPSPVPELVVSATRVRNHVESPGFGVDSISASAESSASAFDLSLQLYPPVPGPAALPYPQPFLRIHAEGLHATAGYSLVVPELVTTSGSASFATLSIEGTLVGATDPLEFSGEAAPGTLLYRSPTVRIELDRQLKNGDVACDGSTCTTTTHGLAAHAIDIELHNADVGGHKVSGSIVIGAAGAGR